MKRQLTWRTRKRLKTLGITLGALLAAAVTAWLCWVIWLGRFVVYSGDGVRLDFDWVTPGPFVAAEPPEQQPVNILYDDGYQTIIDRTKDLEQISGFYVTAEMLTGDLEEVERIIREQPKGSAIMLELKSGTGNFYYDTQMPKAKVSSKVDKKAVGELISYLARADYYVIASVPAFRDRAFGLENTAYGIHHSSGGYLWAGDDKCYWLDPAKTGTRNWLVAIATELRDLGFDEVVFTDFRFPPTEDILYSGDKLTALKDAAAYLAENLTTKEFGVSFLCNEEGFQLPAGRTRLYREGVDAAMAQTVADGLAVTDSQINLVFLTEVYDTRFDAFSVLRPLPVGVTGAPNVPAPAQAEEGGESPAQ